MTATGARSPAGAEPLPELVALFRAALGRSWRRGGKLGLAVSGGADSLALLILSHEAIPGEFEVATIDHGLRPESADECAAVAEICAERSIPCAVLQVEVKGRNLQAAARSARYIALAEWALARDLTALATAHHADDQAETVMMRLNRGSGLAGLAGVREQGRVERPFFPVVRPLLKFRRVQLEQIVHDAGLDPVVDPSNTDARFERARIRQALSASPWLDPAALATSAANLADAEEALEWAARREWDERVVAGEGEVRYRRGAPRAVALRVIARIIGSFDGFPRGAEVARLLDKLEGGQGGNLGGVLATVAGQEWVFRPEPSRRSN